MLNYRFRTMVPILPTLEDLPDIDVRLDGYLYSKEMYLDEVNR